ncbi:MAG: hypothetical protein RL148_111 [Planctomycetota bacterium]
MNAVPENRNGPVVALGAMVFLVVTALVLGGGGAREGGNVPDAALQAVETGSDHIDAEALADRIMAVDPGLVLVDVRPAPEFAEWHLPRAVNLTVPDLLGAPGDALFARNPELVVLYSNGPAHPAQAWIELQRRGRTNVLVLDGGLDEFRARILTPPSLRGETEEAKAKAESQLFALRRAFFLRSGQSAPSTVKPWATDPAELTAPTVVSTRWLAEHLGKVAVVDVRENKADYERMHVPGAVHLPVKGMRDKFGEKELFLQSADKLAARFGALGIGNDTPVVLYAEDKMQDATQVALAFLRAGHRRLAILEGGLLRWAADQLPMDNAVVAVTPAQYVPIADADDFTITVDQLAQRVQAKDVEILDVRPTDFFVGDKSTEARPGHIPGARNRLFSKDLVRTESGHWWLADDELRKKYEALGFAPDDSIVVSCRTGHTASTTYFVLRHMLGYKDVKWFNGSWTEWAERKDLPAETGPGANQ